MTHKNTRCFNSECLHISYISTYLNLQLVLASTLSSIVGDMVEFKGDFMAAFPQASVVNLHVTLLDKSKSRTVGGSASLNETVWKFGEQVGMLLGSSKAEHRFFIDRDSYLGKWGLLQNGLLRVMWGVKGKSGKG